MQANVIAVDFKRRTRATAEQRIVSELAAPVRGGIWYAKAKLYRLQSA